ncbi:MAG: hypothetical protein LBU22_09690 [Dysgonamonadaceae bacterium]|jgi:hypothetical protein|nr:hypothetical protein [Dysgonamonadaceae bacterium]
MKQKVLFIVYLSCISIFQAMANPAEEKDMSKETIAATFAELDAQNKYTEQLSHADMNVLPLGMKKTVSNNEFSVAISNAKLYGNYAELTVFARMRIDQHKEPIFFAAKDVKFSYEGGFVGDATLALIGDIDIKINDNSTLTLHGGKFDSTTGTVSGNKITAMSVDCSGFKELSVSASLTFSKDFITRVSASGAPESAPVSADFFVVVNDWNNLLVELSFPRFQINGLEGFAFDLSKAVFDFSDFENSKSVHFPEGYANKYLVSGDRELWRGVYAQNLQVTLPKDFSKDGSPASFSAQDLLIDDNGISGKFAAENILPIDIGDASGWAFSIDKFWLEMEAHKITRGGFDGLIGLPVSDSIRLNYSAQIMGNNKYQLIASPRDSLSFDMFSAKAVLNANSSVTISMIDGKFLPEANLSGYMTIDTPLTDSGDTGSGSGKAKLENIEFRELRLMTQAPYLSVGEMGYKGEIRLLNLPVSISDVALTSGNKEAALGFNINLNLDEQFVSASTRLIVSATYVTENNRSKWKYKGVSIGDISIDSEIAGIMKLNGKLKLMNNDPVYGDGFAGDISLKFTSVVAGLELRTSAAFGEKDGSRYWFVDGSIGLPTPIPIVGALGINGFGGGLSKGMKRVTNEGLGVSRTGCGYLPDKNMGLGLKAAVLFKTTSGDIVSGEASFDIIFNISGGVNSIGFYGYAEFSADIPALGNLQAEITSHLKNYVDLENDFVKGSIEKMKQLEKTKQENPSEAAKQTTNAEAKAKDANMAAAVGILYNFSEHTLHATFDFYINAAGGMLRGTASNNRAGYGVLHISPQKWYILMGTPDDKIGLELGIPGIATVRADSYFMMGDDIPDSPGPPGEVTDILSKRGESYDYMRDLNSLRSGQGLAFGASLGFSTGDLNFLILYAHFEAKTGFDVMIRDYREAQCRGHNGPIGINGWYANGQAYAYLSGELGVKVNLKFLKGKYPIIKGAAAVLLQAKLPNPTWFGGAMGVQFSLLNGLVKGDMRFKFSMGDECEIMFPGTSPLDVTMISDLKPSANASDVDVFAAPQLALTTPEQKTFKVDEDEGEKLYRISLNKFTVKDNGQELPGEIKWNTDRTIATFYSHEVLPPSKTLSLEVAVGFEEYVNNRWSIVYTSGQKAEELRSLSFSTGEAPEYIPLHNIEYSYPVISQQYFYPSESSKAYVQLKRGQSYLFPPGWNYTVEIDRPGKSKKGNFTYNSGDRIVNFDVSDLTRSQAYAIAFYCAPSGGATGSNSTEIKETLLLNEDENTVVQYGATASDVIQAGAGKLILDYNFSSSKYQSFKDKVKAMKTGAYQVEKIGSNIIGLGWQIQDMAEGFDESEIFGTEETGNKPLITAVATLSDDHYKNSIYPLIYADYPVSSALRLFRDGDALGIPPIYAFGKWIEMGKFPIRYELPKYYLRDFSELRDRYVNAGLLNHPLALAPYFPDIASGNYSAILQYVLPGGEEGSSLEFNYKINKQ